MLFLKQLKVLNSVLNVMNCNQMAHFQDNFCESFIMLLSKTIQWNLCIMDTLGPFISVQII